MLSEEQIELLAIKHAPPVHSDYQDDDDWQEFARAIEREAYKRRFEPRFEWVIKAIDAAIAASKEPK